MKVLLRLKHLVRATIRIMKIQCPYCYTPFTSSELCKTHCDSEHADEIGELLGKNFSLVDYLKEEEIFNLLKDEFTGREPDMIALEARVAELVEKRHALISRRVYLCLWPCQHVIENEDEDEGEAEVNLNKCCDARKYFGEFMDAMCDAYNSDYAESE